MGGGGFCSDYPTEEGGCFMLFTGQGFLSDSRQGECHPRGSLRKS